LFPQGSGYACDSRIIHEDFNPSGALHCRFRGGLYRMAFRHINQDGEVIASVDRWQLRRHDLGVRHIAIRDSDSRARSR
jgi:hypothetical protein